MSKRMSEIRSEHNWPSWNKDKPGLQEAWNKGLTKDTDSRVAAGAEKIIGHPIYCHGDFPYKDVIMRSSWEVAYAKYLDALGRKWMYEPKCFPVGKGPWNGVTYRPDFYLPDEHLWVEIKGAWLNGSEAKVAAFRQRYPAKKLLVITEAVFRDILHINVRQAA